MKYYFLALGTLVFVCVGCISDGAGLRDRGEHHAPPSSQLMRPGPMVDGPGPGVLAPLTQPVMPPYVPQRTQVRFLDPIGTTVGWQVQNGFAERQLTVPAKHDFVQGATYRLKMTGIPGREGMVLYPTLQLFPAHPETAAYLTHVSVPIELTLEDLDQIEANNFVTKVIYLPDPEFQELAIKGVSTLVSTELDPGTDPVAEAERRGTIMAVFRVGNMDLEMPGNRPADPTVEPVKYQIDGDVGQYAEPYPIGVMPPPAFRVPNTSIMANRGFPGHPAMNPMGGMGPAQKWGQPITATPIGLPGPPHLPLGGPAGLRSHTVINRTDTKLPDPVRDFNISVRHEPGISVPKPVEYIEYTEKHPTFAPGELSYPAYAAPGGTPGGNGAYCPPGQYPPRP